MTEQEVRTAQSLLSSIEDFTNDCPESEFSFGHIVLSDINLEKNHIEYCLRPDNIWDWVLSKRGEISEHDLFDITAKTIDFLANLKTYSDDTLDNAMSLYFGDEPCE
jgi:hypothetical protein